MHGGSVAGGVVLEGPGPTGAGGEGEVVEQPPSASAASRERKRGDVRDETFELIGDLMGRGCPGWR